MVALREERGLLRPSRPEDADRLVRILNEPEVARRRGSADIEEEVDEQFVGMEESFVIEVGGEVEGAIQYHEEDDPMYCHAGMDIYLATYRHGQGLGTEVIRLLALYLFEERGHHRLMIDPGPTTWQRFVPTRRRASAGSGSCAPTSAAPTASGTTGC